MPSALYLAASPAAFRDTLDAARAHGEVMVEETPGGARLTGPGAAFDLELVTDAAQAVARTQESYYALTLIDARPIGVDPDRAELLVAGFLDGQRAERDRERQFRRDRVIALAGGDDDRVERFLFAVGQRRIGGVVRDRVRNGDAGAGFFAELWGRCRQARAPQQGRKALCAAGGGVTGVYYELGVLKCLDDAFGNFSVHDFDLFFGISAGAIVASLVANRIPIEELLQKVDPDVRGGFDLDVRLRHLTVTDLPRRMITTLDHLRRYGGRVAAGEEPLSLTAALSQLAALIGPFFRASDKERQLSEILAEPGRSNDFRQLPRRLYIGATDQDSREHVLFGAAPFQHVPISRAVQASAAIHPFMAPVEIDGRYYTDGFVTRTTNIAAAVELGADLIFIIDPFLPLISEAPGFNAEHSVFWVLIQDYKTVAYTRYEKVSNTLLDTNPGIACYSFLPSNRMRRLMASNPIATANYDAIVTQAYASTYRRLLRMEYKLGPELAEHGIQLDLAPVARRVRAIDASPAPAAQLLWA